jgi:fatty-acyl-CoA synthase
MPAIGPVSSGTRRPVDDRLLGAHIARFAADTPDRPALLFADRVWTYGGLDRAIRVVTGGLAAAGVHRSAVVLMSGTARPEALCTMFAVARLGAVLVPVQPTLTEPEIGAVCEAVAPLAVVGDADFLARAPSAQRRLSWDPGVPDAGVLDPDEGVPPLDVWDSAPADPAIVAFTSGTSGRPKGVVLTHENLHWSNRDAVETLRLTEDDTILIATPLAHAAVFSGLAQHAWSVGARVVLVPRFDPDIFLDAVERHGVTTAFVVSVMLARLARSPRWATLDGSSLRWLLVGGAPPVESLTVALARSGITAINSYGLTEASGGVTYARPEEVVDHPLSAGVPVPTIELQVIHPDGDAAAPGVTGEILLRGPSVSQEYVLPDGTHRPATDESGWLHTGDRGLVDAAGRLFVSGRQGDLIITGGENVDPAEVEGALSTLTGVRDVAVVGLPDPVWGEIVTAVVVPEPGSSLDLDDLRRRLRASLAPHKIPRRLVLSDGLPRTSTGKVQRRRVLQAIPDARSPS